VPRQRLAVVPGHPLRRVFLQLVRVPHQNLTVLTRVFILRRKEQNYG
jgi:hypothetical protein